MGFDEVVDTSRKRRQHGPFLGFQGPFLRLRDTAQVHAARFPVRL